MEAVVQGGAVLVGRSAQRLQLKVQYGVNILAVGREGERITQRLRDVTLKEGDILVLQAGEKALPDAMKTLGVLPLAERELRLGGTRRRWSPLIILALAMVLVAFKVVPIAIAFFGASVLIVATGGLSMRAAYDSFEGQVLVLIGALTPLSEAVRHTGGTELIAGSLAHMLNGAPGLITLGARDGHRHAVRAVPAQRADGAGAGADRRVAGQGAAPEPGPVPDGRGHRGRMRISSRPSATSATRW